MRPIRKFEEYIEENIVKFQSPDKARASNLKNESEQAEIFLKEIIEKVGIKDQNANTIIKIAYDIIMERIRAEMLIKGYNATGQGAHEAEVAYLRELNFQEKQIQFCDQLRYFRNGIMCYGKSYNKEYAEKTINILKEIKKQLEE